MMMIDRESATGRGTRTTVDVSLPIAVIIIVASMGCLSSDEGEHGAPSVPLDRNDEFLTIDGMVTSPSNLSISRLIRLGTEDFEATSVDAYGRIETATYTGVRLSDVLKLSGASPDAEVVWLTDANGSVKGFFLSDLSNGTHIVVKRDGAWLELDTDGALMLVDKGLTKNNRVPQLVRLTLDRAMTVAVSGLVNNTEPLNAAFVHLNGEAISWSEPPHYSNGRGISFVSVLERIDADMRWGTFVDFICGDHSMPMAMDDMLGKDRYYLAESWGHLSLVRNDHIWIAPFDTVNVTPGIRVSSDIGREKCMTLAGIMDIPSVDILDGGEVYTGAPLESIITTANLPSGPDALEVVARDGRSVFLPRHDIANATIVHTVNGVPIGPGGGYLRLMDTSRPPCYALEGVRAVRAYSSTPIEVEMRDYPPVFNASTILTIGFIGENANRSIGIVSGDLDGKYRAVSWDAVVKALRYGMDEALYMNVTMRGGRVFNWRSLDLVGRTDNGLAFDHLGRYVGVPGGDGDVAIDIVTIEVRAMNP